MALSGLNSPVARAQSPAGLDPGSSSKRTHIFNATGILSDMDGTLIDSTNAIVKHWQSVGKMYSIDPATILATSHGRRSIDVFQQIDPAKATWDYVRQLESEVPEKWGDDAVEIAGARRLIDTLEQLGQQQGRDRWAIVTSGTRPLVEGWLRVLNLAAPATLVTAEAVANGKPDPECYRLGATRLGLVGGPGGSEEDIKSVLVLEDAPAGIRAGKAAGCMVLALATTHPLQALKDAGADWIVPDLNSVQVQADPFVPDRLEVQISNLLG